MRVLHAYFVVVVVMDWPGGLVDEGLLEEKEQERDDDSGVAHRAKRKDASKSGHVCVYI